MRSVSWTTQFVRDVKRMRKRGKDLEKLKFLITKLAKREPLSPKHRDYPLIGRWKNCRDCHIESDWILIYSADFYSLHLERTGSHSDLFRK